MRIFCEECRDMVDYKIIEQQSVHSIKGKEISYISKEAYCSTCGSSVFVPELRDMNLESLDNAFRASERLIQAIEIQKILELYDIGKKPLSKLLGWGEVTISRYIDGAIPTRAYSDILNGLKNDPQSMRLILLQNKESLTEVAFNKCSAALDRIYAMNCIGDDKIDSVSKYLIRELEEVTPLALQKLLYYIQGFNKTFNGYFIFQQDCEAWTHGPVYRDVYYNYKGYGYNPIESKEFTCTVSNLTDPEISIIKSIAKYFGCYSGKILETMTHNERPWEKTRDGLLPEMASDRIIDKALIEDHFFNIKEKYHMVNIADIRDYSTDLFSKVINS